MVTRIEMASLKPARPRISHKGRSRRLTGECLSRLTNDSSKVSVGVRVPSKSTTNGMFDVSPICHSSMI